MSGSISARDFDKTLMVVADTAQFPPLLELVLFIKPLTPGLCSGQSSSSLLSGVALVGCRDMPLLARSTTTYALGCAIHSARPYYACLSPSSPLAPDLSGHDSAPTENQAYLRAPTALLFLANKCSAC